MRSVWPIRTRALNRRRHAPRPVGVLCATTAGEPQVVPGTIGVVFSDLAAVLSRLGKANNGGALEGTEFGWRKNGDGIVDVTCPYGTARGEPFFCCIFFVFFLLRPILKRFLKMQQQLATLARVCF